MMMRSAALPGVASLDRLPPGWWRAAPASLPGAGDAVAPGRLAFRALVAFTVVLMLAPQSLLPALAPLRIALLLAGLAIGARLWDGFVRRVPVVALDGALITAAGLAAWAVAMVPSSYWPGGSVALLFDVFFKALAVFWLLASVVTTEARLRRLCFTLVLCSLPLAATAIRNFMTGAFTGGAQETRVLGYDAPLTANPNDLALVLNLVLPLGWALVPGLTRPLARALLVGGLLLLAGAVVASFSRAGFVCLAAATVLGLVRLVRRRRWAGVGLLVLLCGLGLLLAPAGYTDRLATMFDLQSDPTGSAQDRYSDSVHALRFVLDHPFIGAGPGMDTLALNEVRGSAWRAVHNVFLQYAVDLGLPGLGLFLLLFALCFASTLAVQRACDGRPELAQLGELAYGVMTSLVVFGLAGFFHPVAYHFHFFYFAGLALALRRVRELAPRERA